MGCADLIGQGQVGRARVHEPIERLLGLIHGRCLSACSPVAETGYMTESQVNGTAKCTLPLGKGTNHCGLVNQLSSSPFYIRSCDGTGGPGLLALDPRATAQCCLHPWKDLASHTLLTVLFMACLASACRMQGLLF